MKRMICLLCCLGLIQIWSVPVWGEGECSHLNIASEYLVMAAELLEMKSRELLPRKKQELEDEYEEDDYEIQAKKFGFNYSEFDGNIGCIVNGDGIALAAMDLLRSKGFGTACFLNVKGGVDKEKIASGIKIIMTNPRVEGILINILGGFLRCNLIAEGIISAAHDVGLNVPLVVRFEGTNKDEAKEILEHSKLPLVIANDMQEAVDTLIKAVEESD